jgi:zinc transport system substrate-binding protein/iron/zinc/copper transport system substrate-binding protein
LVRVVTSNTPESLRTEAGRLARILGTEDRFEAWQKRFDPLAEELRQTVLAARPDRQVVVEGMFTDFAGWLGLEIPGEYGPAEPSPALIFNLVQTKLALVIDNYHIPSGRPVAEAAGAAYVELINFPGREGTKTMEDLFRYNADVLVRAAEHFLSAGRVLHFLLTALAGLLFLRSAARTPG